MQDVNYGIELNAAIRWEIIRRVCWVTIVAVAAAGAISTAVNYMVTGAGLDAMGLFSSVMAPAIIAPLASYAHMSLAFRLRTANERLQLLSETDPLTNTLNRGRFMEVAQRELALAERHCYPTSVVLLDFDGFKLVNETYGHAAGDVVLVQSAELMTSLIRDSDVLARFGGEKFILLLPHTARKGAQSLSERMLRAIAENVVQIGDAELQITTSAGSVTCETSFTPLDVLIPRADDLLYISKQSGRNRCTAESLVDVLPKYGTA